ncbi:hypothetical protein N0V82_009155 [Gnomoniopsis sp. IMI 355080]|nr:hypothetical protein N0V82_009155 [Gnomoniopsis sp. IMI 355080]
MDRKRTNTFFSLGIFMRIYLLVLLFAQCAVTEPINSRKIWGLNRLQLRQEDPPDPAVPTIDSVESTKKYIKAPPNNKGAFWSGIPFPLSQSAAEAAGLQTLEQSVPPEITDHPEAQRGTPTNPQFWDWFSEGFSQTIVESGSTEVTVLLRAPNRLLTGPSDPLTDGRMVSRSNWSEIEFPIMRENNVRVMAMHPGENGRPGTDRYEIWPNDEGYLWQERWQGGQEQTEEIQCGPGQGALIVQCETLADTDTFEIGCPGETASLEPPNAGGQCNYTIEGSANPSASNTFSVTSILTTAAVKLLLSCADTSCSGATPKPRGLLSDLTLAHREAVREARSAKVSN